MQKWWKSDLAKDISLWRQHLRLFCNSYELYCQRKWSLYFIDQRVVIFTSFVYLSKANRENALKYIFLCIPKRKLRRVKHTFRVRFRRDFKSAPANNGHSRWLVIVRKWNTRFNYFFSSFFFNSKFKRNNYHAAHISRSYFFSDCSRLRGNALSSTSSLVFCCSTVQLKNIEACIKQQLKYMGNAADQDCWRANAVDPSSFRLG